MASKHSALSNALLLSLLLLVTSGSGARCNHQISELNLGCDSYVEVLECKDTDVRGGPCLLASLGPPLSCITNPSHMKNMVRSFFLFRAAVALGLVSCSLVALAANLSEEWGSHHGRRSSERIGPAARWLRGLLGGKKTGVGELPADHKEKRRWGFGKSSLSLSVSLDCRSDWRTLQRVSLPKCCLVKLFSDALLKEIKVTVVRHPDTLTMETIKAGNKGYAAEILVVTYNRHTEDVDDQSKFRKLLSFGQHGRELITSEVAWQLLSILAKERNMQRVDLMFFQKLLDNLVIKVT
ncbi:hypothetical protein ZIOFF_023871 [Zingiber officinale]|uniref:Uncharacterized protein n=1 Tax=Zingiber officinale TaxID=94328 RepID=A0A8J5H1I3_ZINOF|nr:hypothetical protein ZIOFF_023871 [Zingiber officinale]